MTKYRTTRCIIVLSALILSVTTAAYAAELLVAEPSSTNPSPSDDPAPNGKTRRHH